MQPKRKPKLLDMVAVLRSPEQSEIQVGDVGTVVELLEPDAIEVEFLDRHGRTRRLATLKVDDVLVLNRERTVIT